VSPLWKAAKLLAAGAAAAAPGAVGLVWDSE